MSLEGSYRFDLQPIGNPHYQEVVGRPLFSGAECERVLGLLDESLWSDAAVTGEGGRGARYDEKIRSAKLQPLPADDSWPFDKLVTAIAEINAEVFRFKLTGIYTTDPPSVARYHSQSTDHFRPHQDAGAHHCRRKLTYVVQLSDGSSYEGGDLLVMDDRKVAPRERGTLVVFPSTLTHVVSPVIVGIRYVIVGWVYGPTLA